MLTNIKMPLGEAVAVSFIGITTVIAILAVIALLIILVSKAIRSAEAAFSSKGEKKAPEQLAAVTAAPQVELINTDEKTAAVIMAIVAQKSGIPLERLRFISIKLIEEGGADND